MGRVAKLANKHIHERKRKVAGQFSCHESRPLPIGAWFKADTGLSGIDAGIAATRDALCDDQPAPCPSYTILLAPPGASGDEHDWYIEYISAAPSNGHEQCLLVLDSTVPWARSAAFPHSTVACMSLPCGVRLA